MQSYLSMAKVNFGSDAGIPASSKSNIADFKFDTQSLLLRSFRVFVPRVDRSDKGERMTVVEVNATCEFISHFSSSTYSRSD
jgi:hypothetical protein